MAKKDTAKISCAEVAEELEVSEVEFAICREVGGCFYSRPMWVAFTMVERVFDGGRCCCGGGGGEAVVEAES